MVNVERCSAFSNGGISAQVVAVIRWAWQIEGAAAKRCKSTPSIGGLRAHACSVSVLCYNHLSSYSHRTHQWAGEGAIARQCNWSAQLWFRVLLYTQFVRIIRRKLRDMCISVLGIALHCYACKVMTATKTICTVNTSMVVAWSEVLWTRVGFQATYCVTSKLNLRILRSA